MNPIAPYFGLSSHFASKLKRYSLLLEAIDSAELLTEICDFLEISEIIALASSSRKFQSILQIQSIQVRILRAKVSWMEGSSGKHHFFIDMMASMSLHRQPLSSNLKEVSSKKLAHDYEKLKKLNEQIKLHKKLKNEPHPLAANDLARTNNLSIQPASSSIVRQPPSQSEQVSSVQPSLQQKNKPNQKPRYKQSYLRALMEAEAKQDYIKRLEQVIQKSQAKQQLMIREIQEEDRIKRLRKLAEKDDRYKQMLKQEEISQSQIQKRQTKRAEMLKMKRVPKIEEIIKIQEYNPLPDNALSAFWINEALQKNPKKVPIYGLKPGQSIVVQRSSLIGRIATYLGFGF